MSPKVSVVVPNYNHAPYLKTRIGSILEQTFQNFELILLDDCSTDGSADILRSYADNPHVACTDINTRNTGSPFAQWLKGIGRAKGVVPGWPSGGGCNPWKSAAESLGCILR